MVDLLLFISEDAKNYSALQGISSKHLIEKNFSLTYSEISSLYVDLNQEFQSQPNIDIWKIYAACAVNSILYLPSSPSPSSQEPTFTPEHVNNSISYFMFLWENYQLAFPDAYERLASKITEAINSCEDFQLLLKWIQQGVSCKEKFNVDISTIEMYGAIKSNAELMKNAISDDKNEILKNLENLVALKTLKIDPGMNTDLIVGYALKWIEGTNDVNGDQRMINQQVNQDPETSRSMLKIIKGLEITDEKLLSRIEFIKKKLPDAPSNEEIAWINHRSQLTIIAPKYLHAQVEVYKCRIIWKGQEIEAAIKTYKDDNGKSWERCQKEAEILLKLSGKSKYFLNFYGCFADEIIEKGLKKYCSNIVMEFCPWTLTEIIATRQNQNQVFTPKELCSLFIDLLEAFIHLASLKIYHQDIKPENILFADENGSLQIKIADFNVSGHSDRIEYTSSPTEEHGVYGTVSFMAPEVREPYINGQKTAKFKREKADVFSLGLVFYLLATFKNISRFNENPYRREEVLQDIETDWIKNIIYSMLNFNYRERPSFKKALSQLMSETTRVRET
ncbi:unnamed protein product [Blepharisma stoltei]|uniref:Protein kinase domain-containing protein n=1 Tax=Blepharisma stoltei TaxID=1481888 RepID=A0AAU9JTS2_9CILI|nr:unnamed protein product [Blepharisma stoltei]